MSFPSSLFHCAQQTISHRCFQLSSDSKPIPVHLNMDEGKHNHVKVKWAFNAAGEFYFVTPVSSFPSSPRQLCLSSNFRHLPAYSLLADDLDCYVTEKNRNHQERTCFLFCLHILSWRTVHDSHWGQPLPLSSRSPKSKNNSQFPGVFPTLTPSFQSPRQIILASCLAVCFTGYIQLISKSHQL